MCSGEYVCAIVIEYEDNDQVTGLVLHQGDLSSCEKVALDVPGVISEDQRPKTTYIAVMPTEEWQKLLKQNDPPKVT